MAQRSVKGRKGAPMNFQRKVAISKFLAGAGKKKGKKKKRVGGAELKGGAWEFSSSTGHDHG